MTNPICECKSFEECYKNKCTCSCHTEETNPAEFNLSEKIFIFDDEEDDHVRNKKGFIYDSLPDKDLLEVKDVKEFIRLLKEEMNNILKVNVENANKSGVSKELKTEILEMMQGNIIELDYRIDKLAGENLK